MTRFTALTAAAALALVLIAQTGGQAHAAGVEVVQARARPSLPPLAPSPAASAAPRAAEGVEAARPEVREGPKEGPKGEILVEPEGWLLDADVRFSVNAKLEDLLEQGVPLHFVTEVEVFRPRWYWKDELITRNSQSVRLTYQAITRQYRVARGPLAINYRSLGEALRDIGLIRGWRFADGRTLALKTTYDVYVRFRLDKSQLPKPFQITMLTDSDWVPVSEWKLFSFTPDMTRIAL